MNSKPTAINLTIEIKIIVITTLVLIPAPDRKEAASVKMMRAI